MSFSDEKGRRKIVDNGTSSSPTSRPRSNSVSRQIPTPVSVQIFNLVSGLGRPRGKGRREYSTELLHPVQAQLVLISPARKQPTEPKVLYEFPTDTDSTTTTAPVWAHLSEVLDWDNMDRALYERIYMRFGSPSIETENDSDDDNNHSHDFFLQIPLHPSQLIPCPSLPVDRPLNTAVVHFSDDSTRVTPSIWQYLPPSHRQSADQDTLLFEEDAFTALDSVSGPNLLDVAGEEEQDANDHDKISLPTVHAKSPTDSEAKATSATKIMEQQLRDNLCDLPSASQAILESLRNACQAWRNRIAREETALSEAQAAWEEDQTLLRNSLRYLSQQQDRLRQIQKATLEENIECQRLQLQTDAQRIRLIKELRRIYPITTTDGGRIWTVRGLTLPHDLFSLSEEDLSAALGMACHAVSLTSRYLGVPLRYRLYCNSSRSAVQDDRGTVFPLFQARPVEREQVEWGVVLLERNIDCIAHAQGMHFDNASSSKHLLEKLNEIYTMVIEGQV